MNGKNISVQTMRRLPAYLHFLDTLPLQQKNISATAIAEAFGLGDVQVRKDLGTVSGAGRPKTGYDVQELRGKITECLGYTNETRTVLVGAGNLGRALLSYDGFYDYGLNIIAAFDISPETVGTLINDRPVLPLEDMGTLCHAKDIRLGIITVPASAAQGICDTLIASGVRAVWNFAPTILRVPDGVLVENENLASSLAVLSRHLREEGRGADK